MNPIALYLGNTVIFWNGIMVALAVAAGFFMGYALYTAHSGRGSAFWIMFPVALVLSLTFSRLLHYLCYPTMYNSFLSALTSFSTGGYCIQGMILGVILAAVIMARSGIADSAGSILDAMAPGLALTCGLIRLSCIFNSSCRGKISITNPTFQHLPLASPLTDAGGKQDYRFATFFMEFIAFMIVMIIMFVIYYKRHNKPMKKPCSRDGHVARMFFMFFGLIEVICDSTRYDAPHMKFSSGNALGRMLTKASGFIGMGMLFAAILVLCVFVYYSRMSRAANGRSAKHVILWILYVFSVLGAGGSEYLYQRFGWVWLYATMGACLVLMGICVVTMYHSCILKRRKIE